LSCFVYLDESRLGEVTEEDLGDTERDADPRRDLGDGDGRAAHTDDPGVLELEAAVRSVAGCHDEGLDPEVDARVTGPTAGDHEWTDELVLLGVVGLGALDAVDPVPGRAG